MKKRLEYMDMVKGIGILGIVIMHSTAVPQQEVLLISAFATPLFFLASGMLIGCTGEKERGYGEILLRKSRSLLLPFLYFSLFCLLRDALRVAFGASTVEELKMQGLALVTLRGSSVLWFLPALFLSEILFLFLIKKLGTAKTCAVTTILTIVSFFLNGMLADEETFILSGEPLYALFCAAQTVLRSIYALPCVCIGYVLFQAGRDFWTGERKFSLWQTAGGAALAALGIVLSGTNGYFDFRTLHFGDLPVLAYVSASLSFAGTLLLCKNCRPIKMLTYFGQNSLIVMATHIDFYFLYIALNAAYRVDHYIPRLNRVFFFVNVIGIILILEVVCIALINRFCPFLIGKRKYSHSGESLV